MNLTEAYQILEVDFDASDELVKENFRWLIKFYHPDCGICKDTVETSRIISAYQIVKQHRCNL